MAVDVVTALTVGRGGEFVENGTGLRYRPSGREPRDPAVLPQRSAVHRQVGHRQRSQRRLQAADLHRPGSRWAQRPFERPAGAWSTCGVSCSRCMFAEMHARYYAQVAFQTSGTRAAGAAVREQLGAAWAEGRFDAELARLAARFGSFDAEALFFGHQPKYGSSDDYEQFVYQSLADDLREAEVPDGASPVKSAAEVFRIFRDRMRSVVEQGGLSLDSYLDFNADICSRIHRLVAGPPALRSRQMLALMDAGVVRMPYGPAPARGLGADRSGSERGSDSHLVNRVRAAVSGRRRLPDPWASRRAPDRRLGIAVAHAALQPRPGEPVPLRRGGRWQRRPDARLSPDRHRRPAPARNLDVRRADRGRPSLHAIHPVTSEPDARVRGRRRLRGGDPGRSLRERAGSWWRSRPGDRRTSRFRRARRSASGGRRQRLVEILD